MLSDFLQISLCLSEHTRQGFLPSVNISLQQSLLICCLSLVMWLEGEVRSDFHVGENEVVTIV